VSDQRKKEYIALGVLQAIGAVGFPRGSETEQSLKANLYAALDRNDGAREESIAEFREAAELLLGAGSQKVEYIVRTMRDKFDTAPDRSRERTRS
jgi:hypothetical protein